jgi:PAS domain S-box-containing protein
VYGGIVTDVDPLKRTAEALAESEARFRAVANLVPDLLWQSDPDGSTPWYNARWLEYTGQTLAKAQGWGWTDAIHPDDRAHSMASYARAVQTGERLVREHRIRRRDGVYCWFLVRAEPLRTADGVVLGWFGAATDIDAQKQALQHVELLVRERTAERDGLRRTLALAEEQERQRIAHDLHDGLGQQLTTLSLKLAVLLNDARNAPLERELRALQKIVQRIDSDLDALVWRLRPMSLDDLGLAEALHDLAEAWARAAGVRLAFRCTGMESERLAPDIENGIYRIAQESLDNIARHARARAVDVTLTRRDGAITLVIRDDGDGFDTAVPLRADSLGLAGMRERAALVGGTVDVCSRLGDGTTVALCVATPLEG